MNTPLITRQYEDLEIPQAGTYAFDTVHSHVGFVVRHLVVAKARGRFGTFDGRISIAENPDESSVDVTIDASSIDTRDEQRDAHLRSPDFFDVERFPTVTFRSTGVGHASGNRFAVDGDLTIRGVTRPVRLDVELDGVTQDPWGRTRAAFSARTQVNREDFGLTWNQALETGGVLVGKDVTIEIEVETVRQP
jgi:polyisoprenoid-binding protein YceI